MMKKTVVVIVASMLACGLWASGAVAKTHKHAKPAKVAKVESMKSVPGQNPIVVAPASPAVKNAKKPETITGSNPMVVPK